MLLQHPPDLLPGTGCPSTRGSSASRDVPSCHGTGFPSTADSHPGYKPAHGHTPIQTGSDILALSASPTLLHLCHTLEGSPSTQPQKKSAGGEENMTKHGQRWVKQCCQCMHKTHSFSFLRDILSRSSQAGSLPSSLALIFSLSLFHISFQGLFHSSSETCCGLL